VSFSTEEAARDYILTNGNWLGPDASLAIPWSCPEDVTEHHTGMAYPRLPPLCERPTGERLHAGQEPSQRCSGDDLAWG